MIHREVFFSPKVIGERIHDIFPLPCDARSAVAMGAKVSYIVECKRNPLAVQFFDHVFKVKPEGIMFFFVFLTFP